MLEIKFGRKMNGNYFSNRSMLSQPLTNLRSCNYNADAALTELRDTIKTNEWYFPSVKPFKGVKNELTTTRQAIILRGTGSVISCIQYENLSAKFEEKS